MTRNKKLALFIISILFIFLYLSVRKSYQDFEYVSYIFLPIDMNYMTSDEITPYFWKIILLVPAIACLSFLLINTKIISLIENILFKRKMIFVVIIFALIALYFSSEKVFQKQIVVEDENVYEFQAKIFLSGKLYEQPPLHKKYFELPFVINDSVKWTGKYSAGHPLILSLGIALGNARIITFTLSAFLILLVFFICKEIYNEMHTANLAALLIALSPFFYAVSSTKLSHISCAFFLTLAILLTIKSIKIDTIKKKLLFIFLSSLSFGFAVNIRQLTTLAFVIASFIAIIFIDKDNLKNAALKTLSFGVGLLIFTMFALWYNYMITCNPLVFPFTYFYPEERLGFGFVIEAFNHTPTNAFKNLALTLARLNLWINGMPLALALLALIFFRPINKYEIYFLLIIFSHATSYLFYYSPGVPDFGPIYYYELFPLMVILISRNLLFNQYNFSHLKDLALAITITSVIFSITFFIPERIKHTRNITNLMIERSEFIVNNVKKPAVVLFDKLHPIGWSIFPFFPSPDLNDDIIVFNIKNNLVEEPFLKKFPERNIYKLKYSFEKNAYEIEKIYSPKRENRE